MSFLIRVLKLMMIMMMMMKSLDEEIQFMSNQIGVPSLPIKGKGGSKVGRIGIRNRRIVNRNTMIVRTMIMIKIRVIRITIESVIGNIRIDVMIGTS